MSGLLTPADVAERFQVTERTVYEWLRAGDLVGAKFGSMWRIEFTDLENFIDRHRANELMKRVKKQFPETSWVEGRCYECGQPIPVPQGSQGHVCGKACRDAYDHKLYLYIDPGTEEDTISFHPEVVPYWT
jgi:excisionase family DNA binding protein